MQLCLTMPHPENDSEDWNDDELSSWHTVFFEDHNPPSDTDSVSNTLRRPSPDAILSSTLARHFGWRNFFASLIPIRYSVSAPGKMQKQLFLGSVVTHRCEGFAPIAHIPYLSQVLIHPWELRVIPGVYSGTNIVSNRCAFAHAVRLQVV